MSILQLSESGAAAFLTAANFVLIVGTIGVLVGTIGAIWSGSVLSRYADTRRSEYEAKTESAKAEAAKANEGQAKANERAAVLEKEAAEAKLEIAKANEGQAKANERAAILEKTTADTQLEVAKANEGQAKANERAAELEKSTAAARLELEKLKAAQRPNTITPAQKAEFVKLLESLPKGSVRVITISMDPEAMRYAKEIRLMLDEAGYADALHPKVDMYPTVSLKIPAPAPVMITSSSAEASPPWGSMVQKALIKIGVPTPFSPSGDEIKGLEKGTVTLVVVSGRGGPQISTNP